MADDPRATPPRVRVQRRFMVGSKWSCLDGAAAHVHYECVVFAEDKATLRSVLVPTDVIEASWQALQAGEAWQPGWR